MERPKQPPKTLSEEAAIDQETERLIQELAVRDSYHLLESLFTTLDQRNMQMLRIAPDDESRLYCQAHAKVVDELRKRFQKYKPKIQRDIPIMVTSHPPMKTEEK